MYVNLDEKVVEDWRCKERLSKLLFHLKYRLIKLKLAVEDGEKRSCFYR